MSTMTSRILPPEDWARVTLPETAALRPCLRKGKDDILVAEEDGRIIGAVAMQETINLHGFALADGAGRPEIIYGLLREAKALAHSKGYQVMQTGVVTADMMRFVTALGADPLPGSHFVLSVKE